MEHLLFASYLVLFSWLITRVPFFKRSGLTPTQLIIIFLLKIVGAIFYGWIAMRQNSDSYLVDTWSYFVKGRLETQLLLNNPYEFIASIFRPSFLSEYNYFTGLADSYWNHVDNIILNKLLGVLLLFSFYNYYITTIFFSFFSLFGPVAMYRVMLDYFPRHKNQVLIGSFLIPSFLFWTSGIHKDGILFVAISIIVYNIYFGLKQKSFSVFRYSFILFGFVLILLFRYYLLMTFIPVCFTWVLASRYSYKIKPIIFFSGAYLVFTLLLFTSKYLYSRADFPLMISQKQRDFNNLIGTSKIETTLLEPHFISFIQNLPQALHITILRPFVNDIKNVYSLVATIENLLFLFLFLLFLFFKRKGIQLSPFLLFCLFSSLSLYLMIGYTVNFSGAIVRYRSLVLPLLITPILALTKWQKVFHIKLKG